MAQLFKWLQRIALKYVHLIVRKENAFKGELAYMIWGEAELILGIWGARQNSFRELRVFSGILGDQWILGSNEALSPIAYP